MGCRDVFFSGEPPGISGIVPRNLRMCFNRRPPVFFLRLQAPADEGMCQGHFIYALLMICIRAKICSASTIVLDFVSGLFLAVRLFIFAHGYEYVEFVKCKWMPWVCCDVCSLLWLNEGQRYNEQRLECFPIYLRCTSDFVSI